MSQDIETEDLKKLGREAAQQVAGEDAVEQVAVTPGEDSSERPAYRFSFLINLDRARLRPGLLYIRLIQKLLDELIARGDEHVPLVQILDRADWDRSRRA